MPLQQCTLALVLGCACAASVNASELADAVQRNDLAAALALLEGGAEVNTRQADGTTALHWATHRNAFDLVQRLIQQGAQVDASNEFGITPLAIACRQGREPMVDALLEHGADATSAEPSGETVLMSCARTGSSNAVNQLLAQGANPNVREESSGQTALMWAASGNHSATVQALIDANADVDARSQGGFTPLLFAARAGALSSARLLIEAGADVNLATPEGLSPLLVAAASIDAITGSDYRLVVEHSDHEALGLILLQHGADVTQADQYGMTPLHYSVEMNKTGLLQELIAQGADPNAQLSQGLPFRRGDYVGREAYNGASPFWLAARLGDLEMMELLLGAGADPELPQAWGVTPLMVASGLTQTDSRMAGEEKLLAAVKLLTLELGADIYATDRGGQTAIHGAANVSGNEIIKFLVERGADPMARDNRGRTPHDVATRILRPRPSTAALLLELAASP